LSAVLTAITGYLMPIMLMLKSNARVQKGFEVKLEKKAGEK